MHLQRLTKLGVFLLLIVSLVGCASKGIVLFPVQDTDIYERENGDTCFSPKYLEEVLQAKKREF
jgi:hypothetical protein